MASDDVRSAQVAERLMLAELRRHESSADGVLVESE